MHRIYLEHLARLAESFAHIEGDEAHHAARVKRVHEGEVVELFDGMGTIAKARITHLTTARRATDLEVEIEGLEHHPPIVPAVHVFTPVPSRGALEQMIDQLSQAGAASWTPLRTDRSEREPRSFDRLLRTTIESAKQCGRAHLIEIRPPVELATVLSRQSPVFVADTDGERLCAHPHPEVFLLVGPEGGWSDDERGRIAQYDADVLTFGPCVMRIETAAIAATTAMLNTANCLT